MVQTIPPIYTVTGENPDTGSAVIRAQLKKEQVAQEVARMSAEGLMNIRVDEVKNPSGNAG